MTKIELRRNVVGIVGVALSFALGVTLYQAFLLADMADVEKEDLSQVKRTPPPKPKPTKPQMKEFSGHGKAVDDKKNDGERAQTTKRMIQNAPSSEMLG